MPEKIISDNEFKNEVLQLLQSIDGHLVNLTMEADDNTEAVKNLETSLMLKK